jgi:hypothetical protein
MRPILTAGSEAKECSRPARSYGSNGQKRKASGRKTPLGSEEVRSKAKNGEGSKGFNVQVRTGWSGI